MQDFVSAIVAGTNLERERKFLILIILAWFLDFKYKKLQTARRRWKKNLLSLHQPH